MHVPQPVYATNNGRISMDEDKTVVPAPAPAPAPAHTTMPYRGSGVSMWVQLTQFGGLLSELS